MPPLTITTDGGDVTFHEPGKARAAARRWRRMARELDTQDAPPEAHLKAHQLRSQAKSAEDWARRNEDQDLRHAPPAEPAAATRPTPAGETHDEPPSSSSRRQAAAALAQSGVRKGRQSASGARRRTRTATRRYEAVGGVPAASGAGELAIFFFGSLIALVLLEDLLTGKGSSGFSKAASTITQLAHKVIAPVPLVTQGG